MERMLEQLKQLQKFLLEEDELFTLSAKVMKKTHDALVAEGFTKEEATVIVAGQGAGVTLKN